jgi:hypothetical protein
MTINSYVCRHFMSISGISVVVVVIIIIIIINGIAFSVLAC